MLSFIKTYRAVVVAVAALSFTATTPPAYANLFSVGINAKAGLDDKTQAFIASLPPQVRKEVVKLLKEALPLIDLRPL